MGQLKIALIGYGYWGKKLYRYLTESREFELKYVYFPSLKKLGASQIRTEYGYRFTPHLEKIWRDLGVESVIIATPINTHYSVTKEALLHAKNVLVEKPLALSIDECLELKDIARERKLKLMTEYTYTFSKALNYAADLVKKGAIGQIRSVYVTIKQLGRFLSYDVLTLLGSHALSILDMFLPIESCRFQVHPTMRTNDQLTGAVVLFESQEFNCLGHINITMHSPVREKKLIVFGENGTIIYDPSQADTLIITKYERTPLLKEGHLTEQETFHFEEGHNLLGALREFYDVVQNDRSDNLKRSIEVTTVLNKILKSDGSKRSEARYKPSTRNPL